MFSLYFSLHTASHRKMIDIRYAWARPGTMWACFSFSGMPSMSRLHVFIDLGLDPSGILMEIGFLAGSTFFTGVTGSKKYPVAPASALTSCLVI